MNRLVSALAVVLVVAAGAMVAARAAGPPAAAANPGNDRLLRLPAPQQAAELAKIVGPDCVGQAAFAMGVASTSLAKNAAFWSLRCVDGKSYAIQIKADAGGTATVFECSRLRIILGAECFERLR